MIGRRRGAMMAGAFALLAVACGSTKSPGSNLPTRRPEPARPTIASNSPSQISRVTPASAVTEIPAPW